MQFSDYFEQISKPILVLTCVDCFETEKLLVYTNITVLSLFGLDLDIDSYNNTHFIEYCILQQNITEIIVLGHKNCRIVESVANHQTIKNETSHFAKTIQKSISQIPNSDCPSLRNELVLEHQVNEQMDFLKKIPLVSRALIERKLTITSLLYDECSGELLLVN